MTRISGTSLEKEPNATEVLTKLPGMFKDKDGKPQAFIGGSPEIYINDRKVQDYSIVENLPVTQIKEVKGKVRRKMEAELLRRFREAAHRAGPIRR